jgi:hypothetical protein
VQNENTTVEILQNILDDDDMQMLLDVQSRNLEIWKWM